ncbi:MAG: MFS transporter [Hyphomonadaceae bacterium]|nr:MFS transporter [Hyphomonadaceae bacterium]
MSVGASAGPSSAAQADAKGSWRPYTVYTLAFLTLISSFNYLDRSILGLALPMLKAEMQVSDTALGLVSGLAFVAIYSLLGVPIAWLADRWSRRNIIAIGFAFWSLMTLVTGFVGNIWQLALARLFMGAGEAACMPPSNALIGDVFGKDQRPLALAIFGLAFSIASIGFFPLLGLIGDAHGWRAMFVAAGAPGVALALVFWLTVKEPARGGSGRAEEAAPSIAAASRFLAGSRAYMLMLMGATFMGANIFAAGAWTPSFLSRVHGLSLTEIAASIGPMRGIIGGLGVLAGGLLADRLGRLDARWRLRVPAFACLLLGPAEMLFLLGDTTLAWMTGFALTSFLTLLHQAPIFAVTLNVAKPRMRALATSLLVLCAGLLGQALGPLFVGYFNDRLDPVFGPQAIRYSLLIMAVTAILAGFSFWAAARFYERDAARASEAAG